MQNLESQILGLKKTDESLQFFSEHVCFKSRVANAQSGILDPRSKKKTEESLQLFQSMHASNPGQETKPNPMTDPRIAHKSSSSNCQLLCPSTPSQISIEPNLDQFASQKQGAEDLGHQTTAAETPPRPPKKRTHKHTRNLISSKTKSSTHPELQHQRQTLEVPRQ